MLSLISDIKTMNKRKLVNFSYTYLRFIFT